MKKKIFLTDLFKNTFKIQDDIGIYKAFGVENNFCYRPRGVFVALNKSKDRDLILKTSSEVKGTGVTIYPDYLDHSIKGKPMPKKTKKKKTPIAQGKYNYLYKRYCFFYFLMKNPIIYT